MGVTSIDFDSLIRKARAQRLLPVPERRLAIRREAGLTQQDIASALNIESSAISRYESGQREPRGEVRRAYAELLDRLQREVIA